jgi:hypothetical protein
MLVGLVAGVGCADLHFPSGTLRCYSDRRCPEGYYCAADDRCWRRGEAPAPSDAGFDLVTSGPRDLGGVDPLADLSGVDTMLVPPPMCSGVTPCPKGVCLQGACALRIFITPAALATTGYLGGTGGISGGDEVCVMAKPADITMVKALVVDDLRQPGNGWVLYPNTTYVNGQSAVIGTTDDSGMFPFPLSAPLAPAGTANVWTGLNGGTFGGSAYNCVHWTSSDFNQYGSFGTPQALGPSAVSSSPTEKCQTPLRLYCVEQ